MLSVTHSRTHVRASIVESADCEGTHEHTQMPQLVELGQSQSHMSSRSVLISLVEALAAS